MRAELKRREEKGRRRDEGGDERGERERKRERERERKRAGEGGRKRKRKRTRGSNLPFSILKRRVYQDEESQEGIKGV